MRGEKEEIESVGQTAGASDDIEATPKEFLKAIEGLTLAINRLADAYEAEDEDEAQPMTDMSGRPMVR